MKELIICPQIFYLFLFSFSIKQYLIYFTFLVHPLFFEFYLGQTRVNKLYWVHCPNIKIHKNMHKHDMSRHHVDSWTRGLTRKQITFEFKL